MSNISDSNSSAVHEPTGKAVYVAAKLVCYGDIRAITRAGTGSKTENSNADTMTDKQRP